MDTIFALSSGSPPAAIAIVRISGPGAGDAVRTMTGRDLPEPRKGVLRRLAHPESGAPLDEALLLWFPGPRSATGEDLAEFHCHGGRAVVRAVEAALATLPGLRPAEAGEFTRRALISGRIDLTQAEGLGDLLSAETEAARRAALDATEGGIRRRVEGWAEAVLRLASRIEAVLDHSDEDDVAEARLLDKVRRGCADLASEIAGVLGGPPIERLHDGLRVVLAGPPNAGKSTLLNALVEREAAIVSPIAGTTRDRVEAAVQRGGVAYLFTDTAGLASATEDPIEAIGIDRARAAATAADIILWLGDGSVDLQTHAPIIALHARSDLPGRENVPAARLPVSAATGQGIDALWEALEEHASTLWSRPDAIALNQRQRELCAVIARDLQAAAETDDPLIIGEHLRAARTALDRVTGRADVEAMLDALFSRFCIGK